MSSRSKGKTVLVPKYKRVGKDKGIANDAMVTNITSLQGSRAKEILTPEQYAQMLVKLFQSNWHGKFYEVKAIVDESADPLTDRTCWEKLATYCDDNFNIEFLGAKNVARYKSRRYAMQEYMIMCGYEPNEMNLGELAGYALGALSMPADAQRTAQLLWRKMLDLFQHMDLHEQVAATLVSGLNEKDVGIKISDAGTIKSVDIAQCLERGGNLSKLINEKKK